MRCIRICVLLSFFGLNSSPGRLEQSLAQFLAAERWGSLFAVDVKLVGLRDEWARRGVFGVEIGSNDGINLTKELQSNLVEELSNAKDVYFKQVHPFETGDKISLLVKGKRGRGVFLINCYSGSEVIRIYQVIKIKKGVYRLAFSDEIFTYVEFRSESLVSFLSNLVEGGDR